MARTLNTAHPLYANIVAFIAVDDDNVIKDLKAVQTVTPNAAVTVGNGTYGRHFKTLINSNNAQGVDVSPGWLNKPSANPNATAFIVVNNINVINGTRGLVFPAQGAADQATWSPSLTAAGLVRLCANGTVTAEVGTTPLLNNGAHSFGGYVQASTGAGAFADGVIEMTRGATGNTGNNLVKYIGGAPSGGWGGVAADYVYIVYFDKVLTPTELADLHASLGAGNAFALLDTGAPPVNVPVAFTGSVPNQTATVGTPFSLNVASYFSGNLTPLTYTQLGDALTGTGLSFAGSTISGTPTSAAVLSKQVRATDTGSNIATTNTFTITIGALPPPPPTGTQAQNIPSTGTHGPALLYKDIALVGAQPTDVMRAEIIAPPSVGTLTMNANSSFTYTGPSTTFTYEGFINDVSYGTGVVTLTTGG